jgi:TonB family protein
MAQGNFDAAPLEEHPKADANDSFPADEEQIEREKADELESQTVLGDTDIGAKLANSEIMASFIFPAAAETAPASSAQTGSNAVIAEWSANGSAPQTGSSAHTSGRTFSAPNGQQGTTAPETPTGSSPPSAPPAQSPNTAEPPASKILVVIDKPMQEMKVFVDNVQRYTWEVSTGLPSYDTPSGTYTARSMNEIWYSKQWDDAPMPHAIFFTKKGHAIHGTDETKKLGRPVSHGCVRLAPENARTLFALVKEKGLEDTEIVLNGETPSSEAKVASPAPPKQQIRPPKENTEIVLNGETPSSEAKVASPAPPKQQIRPPKENTEIVLNGETPSSEAKVASPAPPKQQIRPPKENTSAAEVPDANSAKSPRRKSGNETLHPKIGTAATKSVNEEDLSASATKRLAHKEKPATPKTASRSRSKPFLLGTPARSSPARASPSLANAAYATNVRRALDRNKPRSVGASGSVTVSFAIGASGSLRNARVARSSGKAPLDQAALAIIRQAAPFSPPPGSGQNYTITIDFR